MPRDPESSRDGFHDALASAVAAHVADVRGVTAPRRLSGGASQETWAFDAETARGVLPLILRRKPGGGAGDAPLLGSAIPLETEAALIDLAGGAGVPVPRVHFVLESADGLGSGFVMERLEGETLAPRILRDEALAAVRPRLARECGGILARIHSLPR